jgi:hypothetical protein
VPEKYWVLGNEYCVRFIGIESTRSFPADVHRFDRLSRHRSVARQLEGFLLDDDVGRLGISRNCQKKEGPQNNGADATDHVRSSLTIRGGPSHGLRPRLIKLTWSVIASMLAGDAPLGNSDLWFRQVADLFFRERKRISATSSRSDRWFGAQLPFSCCYAFERSVD